MSTQSKRRGTKPRALCFHLDCHQGIPIHIPKVGNRVGKIFSTLFWKALFIIQPLDLILARPGGFEPPAKSLEGSCSIHLSYGRVTRGDFSSRASAAGQGQRAGNGKGMDRTAAIQEQAIRPAHHRLTGPLRHFHNGPAPGVRAIRLRNPTPSGPAPYPPESTPPLHPCLAYAIRPPA